MRLVTKRFNPAGNVRVATSTRAVMIKAKPIMAALRVSGRRS
jgi:hypothetical protein